MDVNETMQDSALDAEDAEIDESGDLDVDDEDVEDVDVGDAEEESDDDFEYDENGDIVIPEDEPASDEDTGDADEEPTQTTDGADTSDEAVREPNADPKDAEIARLRRELSAEKRARSTQNKLARDALKKLGVETDDVESGLVKIAAEADGISEDEYRQRIAREQQVNQAMRLLQRTEFEKKMAADLAAVQAEYPDTKKYKSVMDFPGFRRFAELRDKGVTPTEAYAASHRAETAAEASRRAADAVRQRSLNGTKKHLRSNVPQGVKGSGVRMSRSELDSWRELFPGKSDKEIVALYKKTI